MPVTSAAKKALRQNQKRQKLNLQLKTGFKKALKTARKKPTGKSLALAAAALDKAVKKRYLHPNKAARLKSRLSRLAKQSQAKSKAKSTAKTRA